MSPNARLVLGNWNFIVAPTREEHEYECVHGCSKDGKGLSAHISVSRDGTVWCLSCGGFTDDDNVVTMFYLLNTRNVNIDTLLEMAWIHEIPDGKRDDP